MPFHPCLVCWSTSPLIKQSSPDATVVIEADGSETGRKLLKTMTWPLMDDDAVPSSYITKVLTCLSKWAVKMQNLKEVIGGLEDPNPSMKLFLELISFIMYILYALVVAIMQVTLHCMH